MSPASAPNQSGELSNQGPQMQKYQALLGTKNISNVAEEYLVPLMFGGTNRTMQNTIPRGFNFNMQNYQGLGI